MFFQVFAMPEVPATLEERRALRPIGKRTDRYQDMLAELRHIAGICDQAGVHSFALTEHHFHTEGGEACPDQMMIFADLAARTERLQFAPMSIVLTANDPIRVAERVALLDQLSGGRVAGVCLARGYQKRWVQVLGQLGGITAATSDGSDADRANRELFDDYFEVCMKAWRETVFSHRGKYYNVPSPPEGIEGWAAVDWTRTFGADGEIDDAGRVVKIGTVPACYERPHPPLWVPMNLSPASVERAARLGIMPWIFPPNRDDVISIVDDYHRIAAEHGHAFPRGRNVGMVRAMTFGKTRDEAFELAVRTTGHVWNDYFGGFGMYEAFRTPADDPDKPVTFKDAAAATKRMIETGYQLCGTLDDVRRQLEELRTIYGSGGDLEGLSWNFFYQGLCDMGVQQEQLEYLAKIIPEFA